jgi:hypothetical protein
MILCTLQRSLDSRYMALVSLRMVRMYGLSISTSVRKYLSHACVRPLAMWASMTRVREDMRKMIPTMNYERIQWRVDISSSNLCQPQPSLYKLLIHPVAVLLKTKCLVLLALAALASVTWH